MESVLARDDEFDRAVLRVRRQSTCTRALPGRLQLPVIEFSILPLAIERRSARYDALFLDETSSTRLSAGRLEVFYRNRQLLVDELADNGWTAARDPVTEAAVNADVELAERTFRKLLQNGQPQKVGVSRLTHPRVGPMLHILPRVLNCRYLPNPLRYLTECLSEIRHLGFSTLLIGCVDPQTVAAYYGDGPGGTLTCHINDHGYWSSGETGIDPLLGSGSDYKALVAEASKQGLAFVQDYVVGTLGYPAQLPELAISGLRNPLSCVVVGDEEVKITDPYYFLHRAVNPCGDATEEVQDAKEYADIVTRAHLAPVFALPKLNLYRPDVRRRALMRARWQIEAAGTRSFRIDMAKHIGLSELSNIIQELRDRVRVNSSSAGASNEQSFLLLEYWSTHYRDLRFASDALGTQNKHVYFFDFPLANAVQNILFRHHSYIGEVADVIEQRSRWGVHAHQLIPLVVDHDFTFWPIYNGTEYSRNLLIFGYALVIMLSTNCPYVYLGAFDGRNGVPDAGRYLQYLSGQHSALCSRNATEKLFPFDDPMSPLRPVLELLRLSRDRINGDEFPPESIHVYGNADRVTISRSGIRLGRQCRIEAIFSRNQQTELRDDTGTALFSLDTEPSVTIRSYES